MPKPDFSVNLLLQHEWFIVDKWNSEAFALLCPALLFKEFILYFFFHLFLSLFLCILCVAELGIVEFLSGVTQQYLCVGSLNSGLRSHSGHTGRSDPTPRTRVRPLFDQRKGSLSRSDLSSKITSWENILNKWQ